MSIPTTALTLEHPKVLTGTRAAGVAAAALLLGLALGACSPEPAGVAEENAILPAEGEDRAQHCYLVLTLTLDQLGDFRGAPLAGFLAERNVEQVLDARNRAAADLDPDLLEDIQRASGPFLQRLVDQFDRSGDGQLSTPAEVEEFNEHVGACVRYRSFRGI
jgi:hypothetical protein